MLRNNLILVHMEGKWIDVSNMRPVIYGAGQGCFDLMSDLNLSNVINVIDGDETVRNNSILLMGKRYCIDSPEVISKLDAKRCYIIITSEKYYKEIRDNIKSISSKNFLICNSRTDIFNCYNSLEDMLLLDVTVHKRLMISNLTSDCKKIIRDFQQLIKENFVGTVIDRFVPVRVGGSKFSFIFGNCDEYWIFHTKGLANSKEKRIIDRESKNRRDIRNGYVIKHELDKGLTVCRSKNNETAIQQYADDFIDLYSDDFMNEVVEVCNMLHKSPMENLPEMNFTEDVFDYHYDAVLKGKICDEIIRLGEIGKKSVQIINESGLKSVIHGDLIADNIVSFNKKIYFIDWEFLSIGNPFIDICYLIYSIFFLKPVDGIKTYSQLYYACYEKLKNTLVNHCYFRTAFRNEDLVIANAVMDMFVIRNLLQDYLANNYFFGNKVKAYLGLKNRSCKSGYQ